MYYQQYSTGSSESETALIPSSEEDEILDSSRVGSPDMFEEVDTPNQLSGPALPQEVSDVTSPQV